MHILTVAYGQPANPREFNAYYESTHLPLAKQVPHVIDLKAAHCTSLDDTPAPCYLLAQLAFESAEDLQNALASTEGQAAAADLANFATGGATLFIQHD
jgi:uncharacterized protein (TIGR02118 family)